MCLDCTVGDTVVEGILFGYSIFLFLYFGGSYFRAEIVMEISGTEFDMMGGRGVIIEIYQIAPVADARVVVGMIITLTYAFKETCFCVYRRVGVHPVFVVSHGGVTEQLLVEYIVPAGRSDGVSPVE